MTYGKSKKRENCRCYIGATGESNGQTPLLTAQNRSASGRSKVMLGASFQFQDAKEARDRRIFDLWLACWTHEEIAADTGIDQGDLSKLAKTFMEIGNLAKNHKAAAEHATDFDPPIYNAALSIKLRAE